MVVMMDMEISCKGHCEKFTLSRPCEPYCKVEPIPLLLPDLAKNGSIIVYNTSKILILNFDVISFEQMSPELFFFFFWLTFIWRIHNCNAPGRFIRRITVI